MAETKPLPVLVNREGGRAAKAGEGLLDTLRAAFAKATGAADIRLIAAADMPGAIAEAAKAHDRIAVAGGDGTMSGAAQTLAGSETELAILPLGTLNHLARDLAIPSDLDAAAALAVHGTSVSIDLGSVNGRCFVNNASIGLYPLMVKQRDAVRRDRHLPKWLATLPAGWDALTRFPTFHLRVNAGKGNFPLDTRLLFLGNNRYCIEGTAMGSRTALDTGKLWVLAVPRRTRFAVLVGALRTLVGHPGGASEFDVLGELDNLTVTGRTGSLDVALDGEILRLRSPLEFASRPAALRVVAANAAPKGELPVNSARP